MSSRRSARLLNRETQEPVEFQQPTSVEVARNTRKRKAPAAQAKQRATKSAIGKGNKPLSQAKFIATNDTLSSLPPEILYMVLDNVSR
jgi:hypothetical protein